MNIEYKDMLNNFDSIYCVSKCITIIMYTMLIVIINEINLYTNNTLYNYTYFH